MQLPDHVAASVQDAHDKYAAYLEGAPLHDSSMATVAARNLVCGWLMDFIYHAGTQQDLGLLVDGDDTSRAMAEVKRRRAVREARKSA